MLNQPPIGYYIDSVFFRGFGLSYGTGAAVVTLFGIGCVLLVYAVGREFYGARVGVLAAGLFALSPWHVLLSRSFLIDAQCLFFSLLYLLAGIWAIRKNSLKLFLISGVIFGVAFLTKAFAVFMLIPLTLIFLHSWRRTSKPWLSLAAFALPALFLNFLWYQLISGQGFFALLRHDDLFNYLPSSLSPSPFFVGNFLLSPYGLGVCLSVAVAFSLAIGFFGRKLFASIVWFDVIFLGTVVGVGGLVTFFALGVNLVAPYAGVVKYLYQLLPLFCLLAASLVVKCALLRRSGLMGKRNRMLVYAALVGVGFLVAALVLEGVGIFLFSRQSYVQFNSGEVAYSFLNPLPIESFGASAVVQVLGFVFIGFGVVLAMLNALGLKQKKKN